MNLAAILIVFAVPAVLLALHLLDRWHMRKAWREAKAETDAYMRANYPADVARYGLPEGPKYPPDYHW